jgi:hypothetical protein
MNDSMASHTSSPPWSVAAWPPVLTTLQSALRFQFVHLDTRVTSTAQGDMPAAGHTLWGSRSADGTTGVSWEWVEITEGVVAMANPFGLVTNLQLLGARGELLSRYEATLRLNSLLHALPWQREVQYALQSFYDPYDIAGAPHDAGAPPPQRGGRSISRWGSPSSR